LTVKTKQNKKILFIFFKSNPCIVTQLYTQVQQWVKFDLILKKNIIIIIILQPNVLVFPQILFMVWFKS